MPSEVPNAEILDSATATSPEALSSLSSADVSLLQSTASSSASGIEKLTTFSPANVPHNLRPITLNATKDMYWFAHTGESSQGNGSEGDNHAAPHANAEDTAATSPVSASAAPEAAAKSSANPVKNLLSPGHSESKEELLINAQRDYEQRLRNYKEMQEEERIRKLSELQMASHHAQRFREQQEEDRRRKIDELRSKDLERRHAVEERKRLIWEAEQERKEAILRRNLERDAKIEARRNAQRNTMSIAFGSSTPREIDLPSGGMATSRGSSFGSMVVLSSVNHSVDGYRKWNRSADVLNKDSEGLQKDMHCPSRPRSSQSMASEQSVASTVSLRSHSGPRRARPFSIAGSMIPANPEAGQVHLPLPPQRRSRTTERKVPVVPPTRPPRARSTGPDAPPPAPTPKAAPRKPPAVPKVVPATPKADNKEESQEPSEETPAKVGQDAQPSEVQSQDTLRAESKGGEGEEEEVESGVQTVPPQPLIKTAAVHPATPDSAKAEESKDGAVTGSAKAPRITSEEEAKAALAEKRRLAREQAEREAELERQRQEALKREEEERIRKEEEEQRRMEEEQLRLAEELRKQEEEKLQRAIEEQKKREEEEEARREQENILRLEKEEQERKLREEAERQRKELEEKLRQEEAARAERKKRVEQIMKRTRAKTEGTPKSDEAEKAMDDAETNSSTAGVSSQSAGSDEHAEEEKCEGNLTETVDEVRQQVLPVTECVPSSEDSREIRVNGMNNNEGSELKGTTKLTESITIEDGLKDFVSVPPALGKAATGVESMEVSADTSPQSNGYGSHDLNFSEISPENGTKPGDFPLLDFTPEGGSSDGQWNQSPPSPPTEFDQLIDLSLTMSNQNEVNRLNNADELNSNRAPGIPFIAFEDNVTKKQESSITDLLS